MLLERGVVEHNFDIWRLGCFNIVVPLYHELRDDPKIEPSHEANSCGPLLNVLRCVGTLEDLLGKFCGYNSF